MPNHDKKKKKEKKQDNPNQGLEFEPAVSLYGYDPVTLSQDSRKVARRAADSHEVYGSLNMLEPGERQRMRLLENRYNKASQPVQTPQPQSRRIGYNPYSVSLAPLESGVYNMLSQLIADDRQDILFGDEEQYQKYKSRANRRREEAQELVKSADNVLNSESDVFNDDLTGGNRRVALEQKREAKRLMREADRYDKKAKGSRGVVPELSELQEKKARQQELKQQRQNYIDDTSQTIFKSRVEELDRKKRHDNAMALAEERTNRALSKAALDNKPSSSEEEVDIPPQYSPKVIKDVIKDYTGTIDDEIERITDPKSFQYQKEGGNGELTDKAEQKLIELKRQKEYIEDIKYMAATHGEIDEKDELSEPHYPGDLEKFDIKTMEAVGVPRKLIEAWKYYNGVDLNSAKPSNETNETDHINNIYDQ